MGLRLRYCASQVGSVLGVGAVRAGGAEAVVLSVREVGVGVDAGGGGTCARAVFFPQPARSVALSTARIPRARSAVIDLPSYASGPCSRPVFSADRRRRGERQSLRGAP